MMCQSVPAAEASASWIMQGLAVEVQTYNLMIATCVKLGQPDSAMAIYQR
jgi:pentatricopeptide repeat protein